MLLSDVRKRQFAYFRKLDEAVSTMLSLATNSMNNDELLSSLSSMSERLKDQTKVVKEGVDQVANAIGNQAKTIADGLKELKDGKTKLDGFLKGISDSHEEFLKRLNTYYDVGTMSTLVGGAEKTNIRGSGKQYCGAFEIAQRFVFDAEQCSDGPLGSAPNSRERP